MDLEPARRVVAELDRWIVILTPMSENPVIAAVDLGHVCSSTDVDGFGQYSKDARCKSDGQPMPCLILQAARATNARRLEAQSRAALQKLTVPGR